MTIDIEERVGKGVWSAAIGTLSHLQACQFTFVTNGRFGEASFSVQQKFNEDGFIALATKTVKRLVYKMNGVPVFYAILRRPVRTWDQIQTHSIQAIGPVDEMNKSVVRKTYVPPGGTQDLSWHYYALATDFILRRGYADNVSIEVIGVTKGSITYDGTLRECLTDLGTLADTYIYWGLRMESDGKVTFFVRKRDPEAAPTYQPRVAQNDYDLADDLYDPVVIQLDHTEEDQDLVNTLFITGGELRYPNLLSDHSNPSFEEIAQGASPSSNMLRNGDFDGSNTGAWTLLNNASIKTESEDPSHSGNKHLELDRTNEIARQGISGIEPNKVYGLNFQVSLENPTLSPYTLDVRMKWYTASGGTLLDTTSENFIITGKPWDARTIKGQSPDLSTYLEVEFQPGVLASGGGNEKGILIDTAILYLNDSVYQKGWRIETTATPTGTDTNADPTGLYTIDWLYDYDDPTHLAPETILGKYDSYAVYMDAYGLVGGKFIRLINSIDGEFDVNEKTYYTVAVTARATTQAGADPTVAFPGDKTLRIGIVWFKENDPIHPHAVTVAEVAVTPDWKIYGGQFQTPAEAKRCRVYYEFLKPLRYYIDGAYFSQSPTVPTAFNAKNIFEDIVTVQDVYPPEDDRYDTLEDPPVGYGPMEEKAESPIVLSRADAIKFAKPIFDKRALPQTSESLRIVQVDYPVTLYLPDGYFQAIGVGVLSGFPYPKLWPERISYTWSDAGLVADVELTKELPRLEQVIERDRALVITAVGTGADTLDVYVAPENDEWQVSAADLPGGAAPIIVVNGDTTETITLQLAGEWVNVQQMEVAMNGFDLPDSALTLAYDGANARKVLKITLPLGFTFAEGDNITAWYRQPGGSYFPSRQGYQVAVTGGSERFVVKDATGTIVTPLTNSWRVYLRKRRVLPSQYSVILDDLTGEPNQIEFDLALSVETGDAVVIRYDPPFERYTGAYNREGVLDASGEIAVGPIYRWPTDLAWAMIVEYGGLVQFGEPTLTADPTRPGEYLLTGVPTDRVGDRYLIRENWYR